MALSALGFAVLPALLFPSAHDGADKCRHKSLRVVIDIGHTPQRPGAMSARGVGEYEFNRPFVLALKSRLEAYGYEQTITLNEEGRDLSLSERVARSLLSKGSAPLSDTNSENP